MPLYSHRQTQCPKRPLSHPTLISPWLQSTPQQGETNVSLDDPNPVHRTPPPWMEWYTAPKQIPPGDTPHPPKDPRFCILFIYISRFSRWNFFKTALLLHPPGEWCIYIHTSSTKKHLCRKTFRAKDICLSFWTIYGQGGQKQTIFLNTHISAPDWKVSIYAPLRH